MSWQTWKLAHAYYRIGSGTTPIAGNERYYADEGGVPWVTTAELREKYIEKTARRVTDDALHEYSSLRMYKSDSVIIAMYGATIGRLGMNKIPVACNQACCVFEKSHVFENRFIFYWLWHRRSHLVALSSGGGQPNLSQEDLRNEVAYCPPPDTQHRIVNFLDAKTAQIDALIIKKRVLLERLAEKRQAIVTQAVTKGLDPAAAMKDSGIDWFGAIPAHWQIKRLNGFFGFQSGKAHEPFIDPEGAYVCVNARFISTNGETEKRCTENLLPTVPGDILMVMSDLPDGRALARAFLVDVGDTYAVNQRVCRIRPQRGVPSYFSYQLDRNPQLLRFNDGNEQTHLPNSAFKQLLLLEPPETEQRKIVAYLVETLHRLDALKVRLDASLARLVEYRLATITAAVTGQIEGLR